MLSRLIYHSKGDVSSDQLQTILAASRANNPATDATGVLFYKRPYFIQVLEGSRSALSRLFHKIAADPRHADVTLLDMRSIAQRSFPNWAMADLSVIILGREAWRRIGRTEFQPETMTAESALAFIAGLAGELAAADGRRIVAA